jgi:hypothetical protein
VIAKGLFRDLTKRRLAGRFGRTSRLTAPPDRLDRLATAMTTCPHHDLRVHCYIDALEPPNITASDATPVRW